MALPELWLLAAVAGAAPEAPPPAELLEFIADWTPAEQRLIADAERRPAAPERASPKEDDHDPDPHHRAR